MILQRDIEDLFGTHGRLLDDQEKPLGIYTLEQPWRGNKENISCIPAGRYLCTPHRSTHLKGNLWRVNDVPGHSGILIHGGNLLKDTKGCILIGLKRDSRGVWASQEALTYLDTLVHANFSLLIRGVSLSDQAD